MAKLEAREVSVRFGGLQALAEVSLHVEPGEIVGLIGPNGAGKTTVFNVLTGVYRASSGSVRFGGRDILGLKPHKILSLGLARTFQNIRLFQAMTAVENVMVARHCRSSASILAAVLGAASQRREEALIRQKSMAALEFMDMAGEADVPAGSLPYGSQRRLEIARALAAEPGLLLLDEPAAGMNPTESARLMEDIRRINREGGRLAGHNGPVSVLMVEHDMKVVMNVCHRIIVLDHGVLIAQGSPEAIRRDPAVIEAYLGHQP